MSRYPSIARTAISTDERNEINEISPSERGTCSTTGYEKNEINEKSPQPLPTWEVTALELNPELVWMHVSRDQVEASRPPEGWDGSLPDACAGARSVKRSARVRVIWSAVPADSENPDAYHDNLPRLRSQIRA